MQKIIILFIIGLFSISCISKTDSDKATQNAYVQGYTKGFNDGKQFTLKEVHKIMITNKTSK
jgi:hypothetical protein